MIETSNIILPESIDQLHSCRWEKLNELLELLHMNKHISGILLGGSITYKNDLEKSDIDLFCLISELSEFEQKIDNALRKLRNLDVIIYQGYFPWTEKLYTLFFKQDPDFSIDLCLIDSSKSEYFFWEPDGYILFDKAGIIEECRTKQMVDPHFTRQPFLKTNAFSLAIITLKKIDKNLSRGHLWNALELLNILRRYVMQIIRLNLIKHDFFLGRVDRDFEDVTPADINKKLSQTTATYNAKDIAQKTLLLINIFSELQNLLKSTKEVCFQDWILKQLEHEQSKFLRYLHA